MQLVLAVLCTNVKGKVIGLCCFSWFKLLSSFLPQNDHLSLEFGVGPDSVSLNSFVKIALLNESLMSCCPSQMDEKPLYY